MTNPGRGEGSLVGAGRLRDEAEVLKVVDPWGVHQLDWREVGEGGAPVKVGQAAL